jgi:hypothetical protein
MNDSRRHVERVYCTQEAVAKLPRDDHRLRSGCDT